MDELALRDLWGALAFRGIVTIIFGLAAVFWPGLTLVTLVYLFSGFILANGLISLVMGLTNSNKRGSLFGRLMTAIIGIVEIGAGVYLLRHPLVSFATFILIIGLVLIARGVIEAVVGLFAGNELSHRAFLVIGGVLSAIVGVIILFQPVSAGVTFVWVLGLYALITGPLMLTLALEAKKLAAT